MFGLFELIGVFVFLIVVTSGGSQTHSPVVRLAYIKSLVRGSMISTHSMPFLEMGKKKLSRSINGFMGDAYYSINPEVGNLFGLIEVALL